MTANVYETLYNNMKNKFTVVNGGQEYTLGEYMLMRANPEKSAAKSNLPATRKSSSNTKIAAIFSYVNDKLTVKNPPVKDKTIRAFPFRTSAAAFLSAVVACAMIFSYGFFSMRNASTTTQPVVEAVETLPDEDVSEIYK